MFLKRVAGPFDFSPFPNLQVSLLGLVPQKSMLSTISNIDKAAEMIALAVAGGVHLKQKMTSSQLLDYSLYLKGILISLG